MTRSTALQFSMGHLPCSHRDEEDEKTLGELKVPHVMVTFFICVFISAQSLGEFSNQCNVYVSD